jgi:hypothetical protein
MPRNSDTEDEEEAHPHTHKIRSKVRHSSCFLPLASLYSDYRWQTNAIELIRTHDRVLHLLL